MKPVLVLTAVPQEARPVEAFLHNRERFQVSGLSLVRGLLGKNVVWVLTSGAGVSNTAARLAVVLATVRPDWVLQVGCGGMYPGSGLAMGDLALATEELDLHTGLESASVYPFPLPFSLLENTPLRPGRYLAEKNLLQKAMDLFQEKIPRPPVCGPFVTVSTVTTKKKTAFAIARETSGILENMEGAAAFHTAALYGVPILALRSVSNPVGSRKQGDWDLETAFVRGGEGARILLEAGLKG